MAELVRMERISKFYGRVRALENVNLTVGDKEIVGTCFTPQDGNSLLSSIAASLWFMYPDSYEERLAPVRPYFFSEI